MDVSALLRWGTIVLIALTLSGCGESEVEPQEKLQTPSATCSSLAIQNKFIVHWKDGSMSVEQSEDSDAFVKGFMTENNEDISWAEHDYIVKQYRPVTSPIASTVNAEVGWGQARVQVQDVWNQGIRGQNVIVAVIDSGVDINHPQLVNQIYKNPNESENGIDDDGNGLIDDVYGYDFERNQAYVSDGTGHGTHVSGIVAGDHSVGNIKGIAPDAKIIPLDFMNSKGEGALSDAVRAMNYAASMGATVINASWGGAPCSDSLASAIKNLERQGVMIVVASGNNGLNLDVRPEFPAAYNFNNQITVGASSPNDFTADFSNYSNQLVDIVAPGVSIYSTYTIPGERYLDGTSMAAPFVSGAVALLKSHRPLATLQEIKSALLTTVDAGPYPVATRGRLNIKKAIETLETLVP